MKLLIAISLVLPFFIAEKVKVWKESRGVVVVEAEHNQDRNKLPANWEVAESLQGYESVVFLQWKGTSYISPTFDQITDRRVVSYYVAIQKEGDYYLKIKGICFDEKETMVLIKVNNGDWKSFTIPNNGEVNWDINPVAESYPVFLPMGYHKISIAGVSSGFLFDKFIMVHSSLIDIDPDNNFASTYDKSKESKNEYVVDEYFPER